MTSLFSASNIFELFIESCKKFPQHPAIHINSTTYTYSQFLSIVSGIKKQITQSEIDTKLIGIYTDEHVNTYASIWSAMSLGAAYVPINMKHPNERAIAIMEEAEIAIMLYPEENDNILELKSKLSSKIKFICTKTDLSCKKDYDHKINDDDLIYLLFTSGSTGKPKGVPISHKNAWALAKIHQSSIYKICEDDRVLQMYELTFDLSAMSIMFPLCAGACIYVIPHEGLMYMEVLKILIDHKITMAYMVPSAINFLQPYFEQISLPDIKWSLFCGEALYHKTTSEWAKCTPNGKILNTYGPTEATMYMTNYFWEEATSDTFNGVISIGKPIKDMGFIIIDENQKELPAGEKGELCIYGPQTASHYWKDETKTKASFIQIEHESASLTAYRTGDLCFVNENGNYMFVGRVDHQVKINGYRIELGEIEFHAKNFLPGHNLATFVVTNKENHPSIYMVIENFKHTNRELIDYLKEKVPSYMFPEKIFSIDQLPLNLNGKTDRNKLKEMFQKKNNTL